jgi:superoxide dismutase
MVGMKIKYKAPKKRLKTLVTKYEAALDTLQANFDDQEIQASVKNSREAWAKIKGTITGINENSDPAKLKKNAVFIHDNIRNIIKELSLMKKHLMSKTEDKNSAYLNASIEIGASARRLSSHYLMKIWNLDDPTIEKHWDRGVEIYRESLETLKASPYVKDQKFKKLLDDCEKQYRFFIMIHDLPNGSVPSLVNKKASKVLQESLKMTKLILNDK